MHSSARVRLITLALAATAALTTAPASAQPQSHDDDFALPLTPPTPESSNPRYEGTPTARPRVPAGFALLVLFGGPVGIALGGASAAAAPENIVSPLPTLGFPAAVAPR